MSTVAYYRYFIFPAACVHLWFIRFTRELESTSRTDHMVQKQIIIIHLYYGMFKKRVYVIGEGGYKIDRSDVFF